MLNRFDLYELAVQSPEMQARFLRALHRGTPRVLREDFCGPASIARAWVAMPSSVELRACGVDMDPEPLEHARARAAESGPAASRRMTFECCDVRACASRADIVAAFNFAACELTDRPSLLTYLRHVRSTLNEGGLIACDLYGGPDAFSAGRSGTTIQAAGGAVRYLWEQREADPISGRVVNAMHFRLPDGSKMRNAFVYHWRLWSAPELSDAVLEAGFASVEAHLSYGDAIDEAGNILTRPHAPGGTVEENYVVYVVGRVD